MRIVAMPWTTNATEVFRFPRDSVWNKAVNHTGLHVSEMEL
jgi:hypothetical protein